MTIDFSVVVAVCGGIISISSASAIVYNILKNSIKNISKEIVHQDMRLVTSEMKSEVESLSSKIDKLSNSLESTTDKTNKTLLALTRERINQIHKEYVHKGWIGSHTLFVVEELYSMYLELGGNSFVKKQMNDIRKLKVLSAEEYQEEE